MSTGWVFSCFKSYVVVGLLLCILGCWLPAGAQENTRTVTGTVVASDNGDPLPGVAVIVVGTNTGTVTDLDGKFSLQVPSAGTVLQFSYIGYKDQRLPVGNQSVMNVTLAVDEEQLDEVVVIGYGSVRKSDLTGAVSSVKGEELVKAPAANPIQALQGKVAGLQISNSGNPGEAPIARIRGIGTLNNSSVIYVVDGVILDDVSFLNSSDIASVEVLKDASATAIFGSRGANGVIIISTKKGSAGEAAKINFRAEYGVENVANKLALMNGRQFANYVNAIEPGTYNNIDILPNTDWQDQIFQENTPIQSYNLSFIGASEKLNYYIGGSYFSQEGVIPKSDYDRITLKTNTTYKVRKSVRIGADLSFALEEKQNPPDVVGQAYRAWPINVPRLADGSYSEVIGGNPIASIEFHNNERNGVRGVGNLFAEIDIWKGLSFRTSYQLDAGYYKNEGFTPEYFVSPTQQSSFSLLSKNNTEYRTWIWENTLNFNHTFNEIHRIDAVVGYTSQDAYSEFLFGSRRNLLREDPSFWYFEAGEQEGQQLGNGALSWAMISYLGRINYSLLDRYLFTATYRRDGSSRFGEGNVYGNFPSFAIGWNLHNEPFFPKTDLLNILKFRASWGIIGNEKTGAYARFSAVSFGLGAVFGENETLYPGAALVQLGNPDLRWEDTKQIDVGLEAGLLENRLSLELDYYRKVTEGILVPLRVPAYLGGGVGAERVFNAAEVLNRGVELNLSWEDEIGDINYRLGLVGSTIHNEVLSLGGNAGQENSISAGGLGNGQLVTQTVVGMPIGFFYGYEVVGIFQNEEQLKATPRLSEQRVGDFIYADTNKDGIITPADRVELGSWIPDVTYGFNTELGYKGLGLSLDFQGQWGNSIYNGKQALRFDLLNYEERFADFWTGEGSTNTNPRASAGGVNFSPSSYFVQDASFLRLRTATISYDFASTFLERYHIETARLYLRGTNLWTSTPYSGYLPDIPVANPVNGAIDLGVYPVTKVLMVGLNLSF